MFFKNYTRFGILFDNFAYLCTAIVIYLTIELLSYVQND